MPLQDDLYTAFFYTQDPNGGQVRRQAGRFAIHQGQVSHLEDWHGHLAEHLPEGFVDEITERFCQQPPPHLDVASHHDMSAGNRLDLVPDHPLDQPFAPQDVTPEQADAFAAEPRSSVWLYHRSGHDHPHVLEGHGGGKFTLDGTLLDPEDLETISRNLHSGVAKLRHHSAAPKTAVAKAEAFIQNLAKADMNLKEALAHLASLGGGDKSGEAMDLVRRHLFHDPMVPSMGNKLAYNDFRATSGREPGVHVMSDLNNFKAVNDTFGHEVGDQVIKAGGLAMQQAAEEAAPGQHKLHRFGGDEFHGFFPTQEHAAKFARAYQRNLAAIEPIGGTHQLSTSLGFGADPESADKALYHAKAAKATHMLANGLKPGQAPSFAHSLVPGSEGSVPLQQDHPPQFPPAPAELPAAIPPAPKQQAAS